jgi:phosphatidylglycerol:prolipoprotein diacylglycerol transferase
MALRLGPPTVPTTSLRYAPPLSTSVLQVGIVGCDALIEAEPQALGMTYWFDARPGGEPYTAVVRFVGHRVGLDREPSQPDSFTVSETVERIAPGSGRIAITARVVDIATGEWSVTATLITERQRELRVRPSTRLPASPTASASGRTAFGPVVGARCPGVRVGAWPAFVSLGVAVALMVQWTLAVRAHQPVAQTLVVSLVAAVVGLVGSRIYYLAEHERRLVVAPRALLTAGMCIQGFVLAAIGTVLGGTFVVGVSAGRFLDVIAPGLLFGMSIGRLGCFFGGCCAGRPTASRFGLWSSDRRVGTRRIPTPLLESCLAALLGVAALLAVLTGVGERAGAVFIGTLAAYTLGRQLLFPWRDQPRSTSHGRTLTIAVAMAILLADIMVVV